MPETTVNKTEKIHKYIDTHTRVCSFVYLVRKKSENKDKCAKH